jgi:hypothetical protein
VIPEEGIVPKLVTFCADEGYESTLPKTVHFPVCDIPRMVVDYAHHDQLWADDPISTEAGVSAYHEESPENAEHDVEGVEVIEHAEVVNSAENEPVWVVGEETSLGRDAGNGFGKGDDEKDI